MGGAGEPIDRQPQTEPSSRQETATGRGVPHHSEGQGRAEEEEGTCGDSEEGMGNDCEMNDDPEWCAGSPCTPMNEGNELQTPPTKTVKEGIMSSQKTTHQSLWQGGNAPLKGKEQQYGSDSARDSPGSKDKKATEEKRKLAMLSLFDGVGTAAVAMQEFLDLTGMGHRMATAAFVEKDRDMAQRVAKAWENKHANQQCIQYRYIAEDVWDLLREDGRILRGFLASVPRKALLLMPAGSPCQQLSLMGSHKGILGLRGPDSSNYWAIPMIAWAVRQMRPDILVHPIVENAGQMEKLHKHAIMDSLNIPVESYAVRLNTKAWGPFPRDRLFFSTLPPGRTIAPKISRVNVWEAGWRPKENCLPTMMRSRGEVNGKPRASTYQYAPRCLLYDTRWQHSSLSQIIKGIGDMMPDQVKKGWTLLAANQITDANEYAAIPTTEWLTEHGRNIGARIPSVAERGRAFGMWQYLDSLGMEERQLFDAQGNMFDKEALTRRFRHSVEAWLKGDTDLGNYQWRNPKELQKQWEGFAEVVKKKGAPVGQHAPADRIDVQRLHEALTTSQVEERPLKMAKGEQWQPAEQTKQGDNAPLRPGARYDPEKVVLFSHPTEQYGVPHRGTAGGDGTAALINVCVVDSIMQLLTGQPPARECREAANRVAQEAQRIRTLLRRGTEGDTHDQGEDGMIPAAEAWLIIAGGLFRGGEPSPWLIEVPCDAESRNHVQEANMRVYGTHGPWNGELMVVLTGGGHTEPIWWIKHEGPTSSVRVPRHQIPKEVIVPGDLGVCGLTAVYLGLVDIQLHQNHNWADHPRRDVDAIIAKTYWEQQVQSSLPRDTIFAVAAAQHAQGWTTTHEKTTVVYVQGEYGQMGPDTASLKRPRVRAWVPGNDDGSRSVVVLLHERGFAFGMAERLEEVRNGIVMLDSFALGEAET